MTAAREERYAEAIARHAGLTRSAQVDAAGAVMAVADAEQAELRASAERLAGALALSIYDGHPVYANTTGSRGGIGGQAMTQGCSLIAPPADAEWMASGLDLLSSPLRDYVREHPEFDLDAAKSSVESAARAALAGPEPEATEGGA